MRISSIFTAVITALAAAGFAATEPTPRPLSISGTTDSLVAAAPRLAAPAMLLAAIDPLALGRYAVEAEYR